MSRAMEEVGRHTLRLYKQFAGNARLITMTGENKKTQLHYFNASELATNDIKFETESAPTTPEKRETLLKLFEAGLLTGEDGQVSKENKNRILEAFGYGSVENAKDISALHAAKADEENIALKKGEVTPDEYDDHEVHLLTHTRYLLSDEFKRKKDETVKVRFVEHLRMHKALMSGEERETVG
jgi:hypothetical protein